MASDLRMPQSLEESDLVAVRPELVRFAQADGSSIAHFEILPWLQLPPDRLRWPFKTDAAQTMPASAHSRVVSDPKEQAILTTRAKLAADRELVRGWRLTSRLLLLAAIFTGVCPTHTNRAHDRDNRYYSDNDGDVTRIALCIRIQIANRQPDFPLRNGLFLFRFVLLSILLHVAPPLLLRGLAEVAAFAHDVVAGIDHWKANAVCAGARASCFARCIHGCVPANRVIHLVCHRTTAVTISQTRKTTRSVRAAVVLLIRIRPRVSRGSGPRPPSGSSEEVQRGCQDATAVGR